MKKLQVFQNCWSLWTIPGPNPACNVIRPTRKSGEVQQGRVKKIYLMILTDLWRVSMTPTLCKLLAHTGDIIEANDGYSQKFSDFPARKPSTREWDKSGPTWQEKGANIQCNLTDVLNTLWIGSDPMFSLVRANARSRCYKFRKLGHNKQNCPLGDKASTDEEIKEFFL